MGTNQPTAVLEPRQQTSDIPAPPAPGSGPGSLSPPSGEVQPVDGNGTGSGDTSGDGEEAGPPSNQAKDDSDLFTDARGG